MPNIIFPSMEALDYVGKTHKIGFTNGEIIVVNLYTGSLTEENVEEALDVIITHELIHSVDMDIPEKEVLFMNKIILENLRRN